MPYPMNGMNNGYGPAGGAAGPGGGGGGYYYPQYPASGAYDGVNGSQEGMHYAAVQGGYDYSNGTTNGGQAGPSRYPYNPYYPPYYAPQYPTISGQLPTANQNPYLTPSPYPVYHSQYAPQHYPQHQQGYYYPPPYQHGPGPGVAIRTLNIHNRMDIIHSYPKDMYLHHLLYRIMYRIIVVSRCRHRYRHRHQEEDRYLGHRYSRVKEQEHRSELSHLRRPRLF